MASTHGNVSHLLPLTYKRMVSEWLEEDCPSFDYGGFVVGEKITEARLLGKSAVGASLCCFSYGGRCCVCKKKNLPSIMIPIIPLVGLVLCSNSTFTGFLSMPIFRANLLFCSIGILTYSIYQGILAGVPFFDEVFRQLDCRYVEVGPLDIIRSSLAI